MNIYKKEYQVLSSDVDPALNLKISTLFTWMQEAAIAHTIELGVTRQRSFDIGLLWVVIQYRIRFYSLPVYDDIVTLSSWPGKDMHLFFPRYFRLAGRDGTNGKDGTSLVDIQVGPGTPGLDGKDGTTRIFGLGTDVRRKPADRVPGRTRHSHPADGDGR